MKEFKLILCLCFLGLFSPLNASAGLLDEVKQRGFLRCGVNTGLLGFSTQDAVTSEWRGFDVDFCRTVAAAIFNDPQAVKFTGVSAKERFSKLANGDFDVLYRNSTLTLTRDTSLGIVFAGINYYDGQGFMVHKDASVSTAYELSGLKLCMTEGTTGFLNSQDFFESNNMVFNPVNYPSTDAFLQGFIKRECDVLSTDQSQLYSLREALDDPGSVIILPELISKEPLGPAVKQGDEQWLSLITWALNATIEAEFLGITSSNVDQLRATGYPVQKKFLGIGNNTGVRVGLKASWAFNIIKHVGNYGEIFERNIGSKSEISIARGVNAQWNNGGILFSLTIN